MGSSAPPPPKRWAGVYRLRAQSRETREVGSGGGGGVLMRHKPAPGWALWFLLKACFQLCAVGTVFEADGGTPGMSAVGPAQRRSRPGSGSGRGRVRQDGRQPVQHGCLADWVCSPVAWARPTQKPPQAVPDLIVAPSQPTDSPRHPPVNEGRGQAPGGTAHAQPRRGGGDTETTVGDCPVGRVGPSCRAAVLALAPSGPQFPLSFLASGRDYTLSLERTA